MRISGANHGGGGHNPQASAIEKQIRKLEKKRDEILEKLGVKKSSNKQGGADLSAGTLHIASIGSSGQESVAMPQIGADGGESGAAAPQTNAVSASVRSNAAALRALTQEAVSSSADVEAAAEDPQELLKQLQFIEMQIMSLRQLIEDDSLPVPEVDTEQAAKLATAGMQAREADKAAALPKAEVSVEGHVDGYA